MSHARLLRLLAAIGALAFCALALTGDARAWPFGGASYGGTGTAAGGGSLNSGYANFFVYQPGGTAGANVFTSWATLYAQASAQTGAIYVLIDDSHSSPASVPFGTYVFNNWTFLGNENNSNEFATLSFAAGASFSFNMVHFYDLEVTSAAVTSLVSVSSLSYLESYWSTFTSPSAPMFLVNNGGNLVVQQTGGNWGDNAHAVVSISSGGVFSWSGLLADLEPSSVTGSGAAAGASYFYDPTTIAHVGSLSGTYTSDLNQLIFPANFATAGISQTTSAAGSNPITMAFSSEAPNASSTTQATNTPGGFNFTMPAIGTNTVNGLYPSFEIDQGTSSTPVLRCGNFGTLSGGNTAYTACWLGEGTTAFTPSTSNYASAQSSANLLINHATAVAIQAAGSTVFQAASTPMASFFAPVGGGSANNAFSWASTSVALSSGAANTLTSSQYYAPHIKFTGTLSGSGTNVVFPTTDGACWDLDFSAIVWNSNTITLKANSVSWQGVVSSTNLTQHVCYSAGTAKLVGVEMTP